MVPAPRFLNLSELKHWGHCGPNLFICDDSLTENGTTDAFGLVK